MGELRRQLEYKAAWHARTLVAVDRWFAASRLCSACGAPKGTFALDERWWRCTTCGAEHDGDVNAARNIEAEGLRPLHPEDTGGVRASGGEGERHPARTRGRVSANRPGGVSGVCNTASDATAEFRTVREIECLVRRMTNPRLTRVSRPVSNDPRIPERWRDRIVIVQTRKGTNVRFTAVGEDELDALLVWLRQRDT